MNRLLRALIGGGILVGLSLLLGVVSTLLLVPFWRWFEAAAGVESIGHSGPSEWCYWACTAVALAVLGVTAARRRARKPGRGVDAPRRGLPPG